MSQTYTDILETNTLQESRQLLLDRDESNRSTFSGTDYPANPVVGQKCYRTDSNVVYICTQITPTVIWTNLSNLISGISFAVAGGTADAMTADFDPDLTLVDGMVIEIRAVGANTITEPTISVDGGTARKIYKKGNQALAAGDIPGADAVILLQYKLATTRWELLNPSPSSSAVAFITYKYIATAGQTSFTGVDANSLTLSYTVNNILVFVNGVLLDKTDYTATNGTSVVLGSACSVDDEIVIESMASFEVADAYTKSETDSKVTTITGATINNSTIGATTPSTAKVTTLDIMGATSGSVQIVAPAVAGSVVVTGPSVTGTMPVLEKAQSWTKTQSGTQVNLTSSSAHIATDASLGNNFAHTMTENTTLDNPTNIVAGTDYKWTFTQHASAAKTLALGNYFKTADGKAFVGLPTTTSSICTLIAYAETTTRLVCALNKEGQT